jgi:hypothetical protein
MESNAFTKEDKNMRRIMMILVLAMLVVMSQTASAGNVHFIGSPTCTAVGGQLCCSGKLAGLGRKPTNVEVDGQFNCTNRGGNQPGGLASGQSGPITPQNGQITFDVCTQGGNCPDGMTPTFGTATINVFQNGNLVFSATVPVN